MSRCRFLTPIDAPSGVVEVALILPEGLEWEALARGALALLLFAQSYEERLGSAYDPEAAAYEFEAPLLATFQGWGI